MRSDTTTITRELLRSGLRQLKFPKQQLRNDWGRLPWLAALLDLCARVSSRKPQADLWSMGGKIVKLPERPRPSESRSDGDRSLKISWPFDRKERLPAFFIFYFCNLGHFLFFYQL